MMSKKTSILMLGCMITCLVAVFSILGHEQETDLKDKVITIKMQQQPLGEVFKYLMENYDIPIGFEQSTLDRGLRDYEFDANLPGHPEHRTQGSNGSVTIATTIRYEGQVFKAGRHPITLDAENEPLEKVFDQIVGQMENYKWEINDGVVNIFPVKGRDERFAQLMGMNVQRFTLEKGKTIEDITTNIRTLPEFIKFRRENKLYFTGIRNGADFVLKAQYGRAIGVGMDFSNLSFRDLLNRITKIKRGGWVLKRKWISRTTGHEHIEIDI